MQSSLVSSSYKKNNINNVKFALGYMFSHNSILGRLILGKLLFYFSNGDSKLEGVIGKMMFMSTVVLFVEFIMMSLVGIMLYKLYISYKAWKNSRVFSAPSSSFKVSIRIPSFERQRANTASVLTDESTLVKCNLDNKRLEVSKVNVEAKENKPTSILNEYIGEFFSETQALDIEPFRSTETIKTSPLHTLADQKVASLSVNEFQADDDIIKVESHGACTNFNKSVDISSKIIEGIIPTLHEFSDLETDTFITVASINDDIKNDNKVMSDKVVMAMLDEAKLVCAS